MPIWLSRWTKDKVIIWWGSYDNDNHLRLGGCWELSLASQIHTFSDHGVFDQVQIQNPMRSHSHEKMSTEEDLQRLFGSGRTFWLQGKETERTVCISDAMYKPQTFLQVVTEAAHISQQPIDKPCWNCFVFNMRAYFKGSLESARW